MERKRSHSSPEFLKLLARADYYNKHLNAQAIGVTSKPDLIRMLIIY